MVSVAGPEKQIHLQTNNVKSIITTDVMSHTMFARGYLEHDQAIVTFLNPGAAVHVPDVPQPEIVH